MKTVVKSLKRLHPDFHSLAWDGYDVIMVLYSAHENRRTEMVQAEFIKGSATWELFNRAYNHMVKLGLLEKS